MTMTMILILWMTALWIFVFDSMPFGHPPHQKMKQRVFSLGFHVEVYADALAAVVAVVAVVAAVAVVALVVALADSLPPLPPHCRQIIPQWTYSNVCQGLNSNSKSNSCF